MQINEELIKQITNAVLSQMSHTGSSSVSGDALPASSSAVPSMAGRDRINEEKTDYSGYPRAQKGTDPKEGRDRRGRRVPERDQKNDLRHSAG